MALAGLSSGSAARLPLFLILSLTILALFFHEPSTFAHAAAAGSNGSTEMRPMVSAGLRSTLVKGSRRRLGSFQICALCTCCGGPRGLCLPSPCCYSINCNIPNRPFGFCSFTPKACNCFGCHL